MAIRKKGNRWQADVTINGQRLPRYSFSHPSDAAAWIEKARAAVTLGVPIPKPHERHEDASGCEGGWSVGVCLSEAYDAYWRASSGAKQYQSYVRGLSLFFGEDVPASEIDEIAIDRFISASRQIGRADPTINRWLSALSKALRHAYRRQQIPRMPHIPRQREHLGRLRWLTSNEEAAFIAGFEALALETHRDVMIVLIDTGMRPGELWKLEHRDVRDGMVSIWENKTSHPRSIAMTTRVSKIMKERRSNPRGPFIIKGTPKETHRWFNYGFYKVKEHLGLHEDTQLVPYVLRHTCCARLTQSGADIRHISQWMGHKSITMTMRYAHLAPKNMRNLADILET